MYHQHYVCMITDHLWRHLLAVRVHHRGPDTRLLLPRPAIGQQDQTRGTHCTVETCIRF